MLTEVLSNHEIIFGLASLIFFVGGFYAIQKKQPEMVRKSLDKMDNKIDKIHNRMDKTDVTIQSIQVTQARNDEKINNIQSNQVEMKQSIAEITKMLNASFRER
jgi:septal ring factor EnvC (AmiA/AmiB activator)